MERKSTLMGINVAFGLLLTGTLLAQAPEPLFGTWKMNAARSKYSPGPVPKSLIVKWEPLDGGVKITVDLEKRENCGCNDKDLIFGHAALQPLTQNALRNERWHRVSARAGMQPNHSSARVSSPVLFVLRRLTRAQCAWGLCIRT
jgi:hypothetical protein